jgi:hypothetical protein
MKDIRFLNSIHRNKRNGYGIKVGVKMPLKQGIKVL